MQIWEPFHCKEKRDWRTCQIQRPNPTRRRTSWKFYHRFALPCRTLRFRHFKRSINPRLRSSETPKQEVVGETSIRPCTDLGNEPNEAKRRGKKQQGVIHAEPYTTNHRYNRPRLLTHTLRQWPQLEKFKMADEPGKSIRSSITKSIFFKDIAGLLLQTPSVRIFLKKASHYGTFERKMERLDCIYTKISFVKRSVKLGHLVNLSDFHGIFSIISF